MAVTKERTRKRVGWVVVLLVVLGAAYGLRAFGQWISGGGEEVFRDRTAVEFFRRYVDPDGRVVRRDQGADTVSEGQAYAMLLAVALDDADRFGRVWRWTRERLQRPDGLLSWRWAEGGVADRQPAADADVDAAYALLLAASRFGNPGYMREASRIADAILDAETVTVGRRRVLVAGPWARDEGTVNPSYFAPQIFDRFEEAFDDDRWREVRESGVEVIDEVTSGGRVLPPDWARLDAVGRATPASAPGDRDGGGGYGLDAARVLVRLAAACEERARELGAGLWEHQLARAQRSNAHPVELVAAGAAAHVAGARSERDALFESAERAARDRPSYYGWAWAALGRAMLDEKALGAAGHSGPMPCS